MKELPSLGEAGERLPMNSRPLGRVWGGASKKLPLLGEGQGRGIGLASGFVLREGLAFAF